MIPLNINFLKSQRTIGELRKVTREAQSPIKLQSVSTRGDKFVARQETKHPQSGFLTSFTHHSLMPRTLNYTKINEARRNLEWQQAEKELGLIQL